MAELKGNKYGTHRVIEPKGVLTQAAQKLDNDMSKRYSNEIICDVISLNIDSASFTQIEEACGGDEKKIGDMIMGIVAERGKQQNPVTGSGGMFIGRVAYIGEDLKDRDLKVGDKIASLVSLSLTPLRIDRIKAIHKSIDRVDIDGQAVLFESGIYAKLPDDMTETLALAALLMAIGVWLHLNERHRHRHSHAAIEHSHPHRHDDLHHRHAHDPAIASGPIVTTTNDIVCVTLYFLTGMAILR